MRLCLNIFLCGILATLALGGGTAQAQDFGAAEEAKEAALLAGAATLAVDEFEEAEETLARANSDAAKGKADKAVEGAEEARRKFRAAELLAIQADIIGAARAAYREADVGRARRYAPLTMARAATTMADAANVLTADRSNTAKARQLAARAEAAAQLAIEITAVARQKPSVEDLLLQQADDISRLQGAAGLQQDINRDLIVAVSLLEDEIARLREAEEQLTADLEDSRKFAGALEEEIRLLDDKLGGATAERRELVMQIEEQARIREQLAQVQALFAENEAEVFEQSGLVVVRLIGLRFASGSATIQADSESLVGKASRAIAIYPGATVVVEGHTDAQGSDRLNQRLSQNRAQTVMNLMVQQAAITPDRISAVGYGESRPVANNETEEGRARNRRIDLIIDPATR